MIQELASLGKKVMEGKNMALKEEPCSLVIVINKNGEFQRFISYDGHLKTEVIISKKGKARFLLDKCQEVLNVGKEIKNKHSLFKEKLHQYDNLHELKPVFLFYEDWNHSGLTKAKLDFNKFEDRAKSGNITFMVDTELLLNNKKIIEAIIEHFHEEEKRQANYRICSICGTSESPVLDKPHGLVKMPKGQLAGSALVSFNEPAFESYGLKGNLNSSICNKCARYYVEGLKHLLYDGLKKKDEKGNEHFTYTHRINISDSAVVLFWTRYETDNNNDFNPFVIYDVPDSSEIRILFKSIWMGEKNIVSTIDSNMFYSCTLYSATARIAVRDWTAISLDDYKKNLADWFKDIEIENEDGKPTYSSMRRLINATQIDKRNDNCENRKSKSDLDSKKQLGTILWNAAIKGIGYKIPIETLHSVLNRIWKGDFFSTERAAIIKLIINRNKGKKMNSTLEASNPSIAYLCGRLFAVIETMQWKAVGNANNGVKERFFAAAAMQPAAVFGTLMTKNIPMYQHKIGGYMAKELNEIAGSISEYGSFPLRFSIIEQGEFALGYYFQKAHKFNNNISDSTNT